MSSQINKIMISLAMASAVILSGCASSGSYVNKNPETGMAPLSVQERQAYEEGVRQAMLDFKGKMQGHQRFVYEPPIVECGTKVPGQIINGAYIPEHETCINVSPGRYIQQDPIYLPEIGE